jgi:nucleotide-binding universal stress UspA family protein
MFRRIVVPLDGSPFADRALPVAMKIARTAGAAVELVHVHVPESFGNGIDTIPAFRYQGVMEFAAGLDEARRQREVDALQERALSLRAQEGLEVAVRVLSGHIGDAVEHEAEAFHADLIVMATHGRSGYARARLGSVGDIVLRSAIMPVLFVRPDEVAPATVPDFRSILVTLDGSSFSEQILDPAARLARLFGARLTLFHLAPYGVTRVHFTDRLREESSGSRLVEGAAYMESVLERMPGDIAADGEVGSSGQPASAILNAAHDRGADAIAMATHGRGGATRMVFGSTTDMVLGTTHLPTLVVRPRVAASVTAEAVFVRM